MIFETRQYQEDAIKSLKDNMNITSNILLQMPTGAGKAYILAKITSDLIDKRPSAKILYVMDREILVSQLKDTLMSVNKDINVSFACTGLNKNVDFSAQVIIGTRQTIANRLDDLPVITLLVADEAHTWSIPGKDQEESDKTQFQKIYEYCRSNNPMLRLLGCTATAYNLQAGYIYGNCHKAGLEPYFKTLTHRVTYAELTSEGYLVPVVGHVSNSSIDLSSVKMTGGEYNLGHLSETMGKYVDAIPTVINQYCADRKHILIFCVDIDHAEKVYKLLKDEAVIIHSQQHKMQREMAMRILTSGQKRIAVSVNILSIGFDYPPVDCIILARPTKSTSLALQQIGRGLRPYKDKKDCLIVDVTDNIITHFPDYDFDKPRVNVPRPPSGYTSKPFKMCPECQNECHAASRFCPECNYEFKKEEMPESYLPKLEKVDFNDVDNRPPVDYICEGVTVSIHTSRKNNNKLLKVTLGCSAIDELLYKNIYLWICFEDYYSGYAVEAGAKTWYNFTNVKKPDNVKDAYLIADEDFRCPTRITCKYKKGFLTVIDYQFNNDEIKQEFSGENGTYNTYDDFYDEEDIPF